MLHKARGCWYYHIVMSHEPNNRKLLLSWFQLWSNKLNCLMTWWWLKQSETYSISCNDVRTFCSQKWVTLKKSVQFSKWIGGLAFPIWGCRLCCLYNLGHPLLHCWVLLIMASKQQWTKIWWKNSWWLRVLVGFSIVAIHGWVPFAAWYFAWYLRYWM